MTTTISVLLAIADEQKLAGDAFSRQLSALKVKNTKPLDKPQKISDGGGLTLYIPPSGGKSWRYRFRLDGREQTLTLGGYPEIGLDTARTAHRAARWLVERGTSPINYAQDEKVRAKAAVLAETMGTFGAVASRWMEATTQAISTSTAKHRAAMLNNHVLPQLGAIPIAEVTRKSLVELLSKIDQSAPESAKCCRIYIKQIFDFALDFELVLGNPTPSTKVLVNHSSRKVNPRKALPLNQLGNFLRTLDVAINTDIRTKVALKLLILTWTRTSEVIGARWEEFDLKDGIWVIPADRMKAGEEHKVYLSSQALSLLKQYRMYYSGQFVFPNLRDSRRPMSRMTLSAWRQRWGFKDDMEIHGFRAVASTWANESGDYRPDVIEVALAHREKDRVRAAYNRAMFVDEVMKLWQDWGDLCERVCLEVTANGNFSA